MARAFEASDVQRVIAETLPDLRPSIGVLERAGFRQLGEGSEEWAVRYAITRDEFAARG